MPEGPARFFDLARSQFSTQKKILCAFTPKRREFLMRRAIEDIEYLYFRRRELCRRGTMML